MRSLVIICIGLIISINAFAQRGFNYYKDSLKNGSSNAGAFADFKKAYYDCIWNWTTSGADSAEYYLKSAIGKDSNYVAAYAFLAHVYQFKTYRAEAFDKYFALEKKYAEKAASFNPRTGDTYSVMSDVAWTEHDTSKALNLLRDAIRREPDNVGNYLWISIRYRQMKQDKYYDSAVYNLHRIITLDPEYGQAYMKMGNVYHLDKHQLDSARIYYHKALDIYHTIVPRDNRMMDGYYWLAETFKYEHRYDSAIHYYSLFLNEMEPSNMYIRDMRLSATYKAIYECNQHASNLALQKLVAFNKTRISKDPTNQNLMLEILEADYMSVNQDSIDEKNALPLARYIQTMPLSDTIAKIFALDDEFVILRRLHRNHEAKILIESAANKYPNDPIVLFDMARMKIFLNDTKSGFAYLNKSKMKLNNIFSKPVFVDQLKNADFDKVRNTAAFSDLSK